MDEQKGQGQMNKTQRTGLLKAVEALLTARRIGNLKREQIAYDSLRLVCEKLNVDLVEAIEQGRKYLIANGVAAGMNAIVW